MEAHAGAGVLAGPLPERDDAVLSLSRHVERRLLIAMTIAHTLGAVDVFVLLKWVLPGASFDTDRDLVVNLVGIAVYIPFATFVAWAAGRRSGRQIRGWLSSGAPLTSEQRTTILREPMRCTAVSGELWLGALVVFGALNLSFSASIALDVAVTIGLGAITVCTVAYLLAEKIMRPITALALADGRPARLVGPGVKGRLVIVWLTGTGVPLIGLVILGVRLLTEGVGDSTRVALTVLVLPIVAVVMGLGVLLIASRSVAEPLTRLRRALGQVEAGDLSGEVRVDDASEIGLLQAGFNGMAAGLRERERIRDLFDRHVGSDVARAALDAEPVLGGETRDVAILFVDIVGSTSLAARRSPDQVVRVLNRFFGVVVDVAGDHGGWVNKFEGDAALVVFGAPAPQSDAAGCALAAGRDLAARLARDVREIDVGIGISAGPVVAGWMGAERRLEYTVVGDPVNEAARLCELAKRQTGRVLASERILACAERGEARRWALGDETVLRGRTQPTRLAVPA